jgi:hypothetical protein
VNQKIGGWENAGGLLETTAMRTLDALRGQGEQLFEMEGVKGYY